MLRRIAAEGIGSLLLVATVIGSGIMAERLAAGNLAVALIANTGATVAVLATLIARDHGRTSLIGHLCRYLTIARTSVHSRAALWRGGGDTSRSLVVRRVAARKRFLAALRPSPNLG
jgi:hypothetical protein